MTSRSLLAGAAIALAVCAPAFAQFAGVWETNLGRMHLEQDSGRVHGEYDRNGGRLDADVDQNDLTGLWAQDDSDHRCRDKQMGTHYWGHFKLHLDDNGKVFHGYRSLCDGDPASGGEWRGWREDR
jgi:hypothetical protein